MDGLCWRTLAQHGAVGKGALPHQGICAIFSHPMNTSIAPYWLSDPAWLAMDATSRGMHAQLLLVAARRKPAGSLPDDDVQIRRWLGLPTKKAATSPAQTKKAWDKLLPHEISTLLAGVLSNSQSIHSGEDPDLLTLWLWENHWKPVVMGAWQRIDEDLIEQFPHLAKQEGGWYQPIAHSLADASAFAAPTVQPTAGTTKAVRKKSSKTTSLHWDAQLDVSGQAANQGLEQGGFNLDMLMDQAQVLARWRPEMGEASRKSMWDVGVDCLAGVGASDVEKAKARGILGKHIKQYGEETVAKAVGSMAMRSIPPADAVAFLQGMLRQETEGSTAERAAREKRANLCL